MLNINTTRNSLVALASQIKQEDLVKINRFPQSNRNLLSKIVGVIEFENMAGIVENIPIELASDDHFSEHLTHGIDIPCINLGKMTDGSVIMIINERFREYAQRNDHWSNSYVNGCLSHELGHYISGHFDDDKHPLILDNYNQYQTDFPNSSMWSNIARSLLSGGVFDVEYDADLAALHFCDINDIIVIHIQNAVYADTLGVRCESLNRVERHIKLMDTDNYHIKKLSCSYFISTDEEIDSILNENISEIITEV